MADSLDFDGCEVAALNLERRFAIGSGAAPDRVFLFRAPEGWRLVVFRYVERGELGCRTGHGSVHLLAFGSVANMAAHIQHTYGWDAWYDTVEAGRDDPNLFAAWVLLWFPRVFDRASVIRRDLALFRGLWSGDPVPAPGRALAGWQTEALGQIAGRLGQLGLQVVVTVPPGEEDAAATVEGPHGNTVLGRLRVRRYGFEVVGVVRVDPVGEIYVRLPDDPVFLAVEQGSESS